MQRNFPTMNQTAVPRFSIPEPSYYTDHVFRAVPYQSNYECMCTCLKCFENIDNYFDLN